VYVRIANAPIVNATIAKQQNVVVKNVNAATALTAVNLIKADQIGLFVILYDANA